MVCCFLKPVGGRGKQQRYFNAKYLTWHSSWCNMVSGNNRMSLMQKGVKNHECTV